LKKKHIYIQLLIAYNCLSMWCRPLKNRWVLLYIYYMTSRATYQNIFPEVVGMPWRVISPDAEGTGWHNTPGLSCHREENILVKLPEMSCNICYITFLGEYVFLTRNKKLDLGHKLMNSFDNHGIPFICGTLSVEIICDFYSISENALFPSII
jgi:hypothetical protein